MHGAAFDTLLSALLPDHGSPPRHRLPAITRTAAAYGFFALALEPGGVLAGPRATVALTPPRPGAGGRGAFCPARRHDDARVHSTRAGAGSCRPAQPAWAGRTPSRRLSRVQHDAVDLFASLGAPVSCSFTPEELRSAFRAVARRYHPDRHPGRSAEERARLGRMFARALEAYHTLRTA